MVDCWNGGHFGRGRFIQDVSDMEVLAVDVSDMDVFGLGDCKY